MFFVKIWARHHALRVVSKNKIKLLTKHSAANLKSRHSGWGRRVFRHSRLKRWVASFLILNGRGGCWTWPSHCLFRDLDYESILEPGSFLKNSVTQLSRPVCEDGRMKSSQPNPWFWKWKNVHCKSGVLGRQNHYITFLLYCLFYNSRVLDEGKLSLVKNSPVSCRDLVWHQQTQRVIEGGSGGGFFYVHPALQYTWSIFN